MPTRGSGSREAPVSLTLVSRTCTCACAAQVIQEGHIFFCPKGHTYNVLDRMFGVLIAVLCAVRIESPKRLLDTMRGACNAYNTRDARELHCMFDFKAWFEPHAADVHGFTTNALWSGACLLPPPRRPRRRPTAV